MGSPDPCSARRSPVRGRGGGMAVMEPFFFFFNNLVFFLVLIATSLAVNLQFEKNEILTGDVKRSEDKKPEFTDVVTNQTVVAGRQEQ